MILKRKNGAKNQNTKYKIYKILFILKNSKNKRKNRQKMTVSNGLDIQKS